MTELFVKYEPIVIEFTVPGTPISQPRQRMKIIPGQKFPLNYTPAKSPVNEYKAAVRLVASQICEEPLAGPVAVSCVFVFARPQGHFGTGRKAGTLKASAPRWHTTNPDAENVAKAVLDALSTIAYMDDRQVARLTCVKRYAAVGEQPHTEIRIETLD